LNKKNKAFLELLLAAFIWGFGFIATIWALKDFSIVGFMVMRFFIAWLAGEILRLLFFKNQIIDWFDFRLSLPAGFLMAAFLIPQTFGLLFTTATNSGFLTILYVVLVPLLSRIIFKKNHPLPVYWLAVLAFAGAWLMMSSGFVFRFNVGDLWTILCAVMASLHILYLGQIAPKIKDSFRFNNYQSLCCLFFCIPLIGFDKNFNLVSYNLWPWVGLLCTAIGSSLIGFMIQVRAQKILSETTAAQFFLLESPFAMLFGILLLNEKISLWQALGAFLILASSLITLKLESRKI
jgi:drug/metabolite transporter (DMT)-like permease